MTDREIEILLSWFAQCSKPMTLEDSELARKLQASLQTPRQDAFVRINTFELRVLVEFLRDVDAGGALLAAIEKGTTVGQLVLLLPQWREIKTHLANTRETIPPHLRINEVLGYLEKRIDRVFKEELNR